MKTITPLQMKETEQAFMKRSDTRSLDLMERAAEALVNAALKYLPDTNACVVCCCGKGNNGGDGYATMRLLAEKIPALSGTCILLDEPNTPEAVYQLNLLKEKAPQIHILHNDTKPEEKPDLIVDSLFGTGFSGRVHGKAAELIEWIDSLAVQGVPVLAVDIPSGLNGLTGSVEGTAVFADETVTFHRPKPGLFLGKGPELTGRISIADIGIPIGSEDGPDLLEKGTLSRLIPPRRRCTHKGNYGKVLVWAGSRGMAGAAAFCAEAALRTGAGLVRIICPESIADIVQILCPAATCQPLPGDETDEMILRANLAWADAMAIGCGMGKSDETRQLLGEILSADPGCPYVLDADGLNLLSPLNTPLPGEVILTPHPAEAARLLAVPIREITADPSGSLIRLCRLSGQNVILKDACSLMSDGSRFALNPYGCAAMAKGGSGDILCGILAALLAGTKCGAYNMSTLEIMQAACALHGLAGEAASEKLGEISVMPGDICRCIGQWQQE